MATLTAWRGKGFPAFASGFRHCGGSRISEDNKQFEWKKPHRQTGTADRVPDHPAIEIKIVPATAHHVAKAEGVADPSRS